MKVITEEDHQEAKEPANENSLADNSDANLSYYRRTEANGPSLSGSIDLQIIEAISAHMPIKAALKKGSQP